jgi:drug/metabolite transporter (DMT)-like permease
MSFVPVLIKAIQANEITIGIVRLAIAAVGIALLAKGKKQQLFSRSNIKWMLLLGFVFSSHWYLYFKSLKMATVSLATIGVATFGIHLLYLNRLFFKQPVNKSDFIAVAIALSGVALVTPNSHMNPEHFNGFLMAIVSGFLYACLPIINRSATHFSIEQKAFGQFGFGLLFFALFAPYGQWQLTRFDWLGLLILGIVCTLVAHTLWIKVSTELPNSITATIYYFYVPIAMCFSYFLFDEVISWQKITGASLVISANILVVLMHNRRTKQRIYPS